MSGVMKDVIPNSSEAEGVSSLESQKLTSLKDALIGKGRHGVTASASPDTRARTSMSEQPPARGRHPRRNPRAFPDDARPRMTTLASSPALPTTTTSAAAAARRRCHSMEVEFDGGDTQPIDSQVFSSILQSARKDAPFEFDDDPQSLLEEFTNGTTFVSPAKTCEEGDTGYVDILQGLPEPHDGAESPELQTRALPNTPVVAGQKRDHRGAVVTPATVTPGAALQRVLGATPNGVGLSQLFNPTQLPSSPVTDGLRSDPVFQRPSPNIDFLNGNANLIGNSSPTSPLNGFVGLPTSSPRTSSPSRMVRSDPPRAATEPRDDYVTMKESQEQREARRRALMAQKNGNNGEDDASSDEVAKELARRKQKAELAQIVSLEMKTVVAPRSSIGRKQISGPRAGNQAGDLSSTGIDMHQIASTDPGPAPLKQVHHKRDVVEVSDDSDSESVDSDDDSDDNGNDAEKTPMQTKRNVHVLMTSSHSIPLNRRNVRNIEAARQEVSPRLGDPTSEAECVPASASQPERPSQRTQKSSTATGPLGIPDSQPQSDDQPAVDAELDLLPTQIPESSPEARVEARLPGGTTLLKDSSYLEPHLSPIYDTSSICPPPQDPYPSTNLGRSQNLPSSPPVLRTEVTHESRNTQLGDEDGFIRAPTPQAWEIQKQDHSQDRAGDAAPGSTKIRDTAIPQSTRSNTDRPLPPTDSEEQPAMSDKTSGAAVYHSARTHQTDTTTEVTNSPLKRQSQRASSRPDFDSPIRPMAAIAAEPSQDPQDPLEPLDDIDIDFVLPTKDDDDFTAILNASSSPVQRPRKRQKMYRSRALKEPAKEVNQLPKPQSHRESSPSYPAFENFEDENTTVQRQVEACPKPALTSKGRLVRPKKRVDDEPDQDRAPPAVNGTSSGEVQEIDETPQLGRSVVDGSGSASRQDVYSFESQPQERPVTRTVRHKAFDRLKRAAVAAPSDAALDAPSVNPQQLTHTPIGAACAEPDDAEFRAPNRVMAVFKDAKLNYYPATCVGPTRSPGCGFRVRFDDGEEADVPETRVRSLLLRGGDTVKVEQTGFGKNAFTVVGFKDRVAKEHAEEFPVTDVYGHKSVLLAVKQSKRQSNGIPASGVEAITVPVSSVYLPQSLWEPFKDRKYAYVGPAGPTAAPVEDAASVHSAAQTPTRSRRKSKVHFKPGTKDGDSISAKRNGRGASTTVLDGPQTKSNILDNMAFAVSFPQTAAGTDEIRASTVRTIRNHGGHILEQGLQELFEDFSRPAADPDASDDAVIALRLTATASNFGFTALLTDGHSSTVKYFQALALSLPCLHHFWLRDSVAAGHPLPWSRYLLPAGESEALGNAVRSRVLSPPHDSAGVRLADVVRARQKLLAGDRVMFVNRTSSGPATARGGNSKAAKEAESRRRAHLFLAYALGAESVRLVRDLAEARTLLQQSDRSAADSERGWNWVFVVEDAETAERALFGCEGVGVGTKRKREAVVVRRPGVRVVDENFVKQSLILGELLET